MNGRLKKIVFVLVVLYIIWKFLSGLLGGPTEPSDAPPKFFSGRPWMERFPKDERDMFRAMMFVEVRDRRLGIRHHGSFYRHTTDILEWKVERGTLTYVVKQDDEKKTFSLRTYTCEGRAPAPFDLCLELKSGGKTETWYSRDDWGRDDASLSIEHVEALVEDAR